MEKGQSIASTSGSPTSIGPRSFRIVTTRNAAGAKGCATGSAGGYDEGPTPTELFAASLAGCVAFYVGRFLRRHGRLGEAFEVECDFTMSEGQPARVQAIDLRVVIRADIDAELRDAVDRVARHCTVHNSLVQTPEVSIAIETGALAPV